MIYKAFRYVIFGFLASLSLFWGASASALVIDYAHLANTIPGEKGFAEPTGFAHTVGGITVTAHGLKFNKDATGYEDSATTYNAYLDSTWTGYGPGGLGVCKTLTSGKQCTPSSDDNLTNGEMLKLVFSAPVTITEFLFRNANHGETFDANADFELAIDNGVFASHALTHVFNTPVTGTEFRFIVGAFAENNFTGFANELNDELYIQTVTFNTPVTTTSVPEPSVLGLASLGLLVFGFGGGQRWRGA